MTNIVPYTRQLACLDVDGNEPGLISAWDLVRNGSAVADAVGINNGTLIGGAHNQYSALGKTLYFNGASESNMGNNSSLSIASGSITFSFWARFTDVSAFQGLVSKGSTASNQNYFIRVNNGILEFYFRNVGNTANILYATNDAPLKVGRAYHIVLAHTFGNGALTRFYVNGVNRTGTWNSPPGDDLPFTNANQVFVGSRFGNIYNNGDIGFFKFFNIHQSQEWVTREYDRGRNSALWKMCYGVNISSAPVTGGNVENSPVRVTNGGQFQVSSYSLNGLAAKCYECTTAGTIELMSGYYHANPIDAAFGDHELHIEKAAGHTTKLGLINQQRDNTANGYGFQILTDGTTTIEEWGVGTIVSGGSITPGTLAKLNLKRRQFDDRLEGVIDDTSFGTGTDSTILQSYYSVFDCGVGDKIIISDINGGHAYTKRVFA